MHGGDLIARVLEAHGVRFVFTLCGGHISPILSGAKTRGIRVVDTRHEVTTVFAADAVARMTGIPGVAAVTAGPGVTNTITAMKNAQMAQSPVVLLGGATATALKGRGALQDIDQIALIEPHVKSAVQVKRVKDLVPALEEAFEVCQTGVPGPVFVECPLDLLYPEAIVREWYGGKTAGAKHTADKLLHLYLKRHVDRLFAGANDVSVSRAAPVTAPPPHERKVARAAEKLRAAERPVMLVGSQAVLEAGEADAIADAIEKLGMPVYLSGMARGLLGKGHRLQMRHKRRNALKEADLVILAGVPCDFRLDYGSHIRRGTTLISVNRSRTDMTKNRRPDLGVLGDAGRFIRWLSAEMDGAPNHWTPWLDALRARDNERNAEIDAQAGAQTDLLNPLAVCQELERQLADDSVLVADGGDFVATASYITSPRAPLRWLDPGVFGTLGVGAGFALGAKLVHPEAEVWVIYGDGSVGYSISEFDTFVRHGIPIIALVGNDACWMQIARDQIDILDDDVAVMLDYSNYHEVAAGFGGVGFTVREPGELGSVLSQAKAAAQGGKPVLVNAHIGKTEFRKGSISV